MLHEECILIKSKLKYKRYTNWSEGALFLYANNDNDET